jgi:hypothetical protein
MEEIVKHVMTKQDNKTQKFYCHWEGCKHTTATDYALRTHTANHFKEEREGNLRDKIIEIVKEYSDGYSPTMIDKLVALKKGQL